MAKPRSAPTPRPGRGWRLALVSARFHADITDAMQRDARQHARSVGARIVAEADVAGSYDLPLVVRHLLRRRDVDAAVALGAIVTGETGHDEAIAHALFHALAQVALETGKPVGLGVTGPRQTFAQAEARIDRAGAAVDAVVSQLAALGAPPGAKPL